MGVTLTKKELVTLAAMVINDEEVIGVELGLGEGVARKILATPDQLGRDHGIEYAQQNFAPPPVAEGPGPAEISAAIKIDTRISNMIRALMPGSFQPEANGEDVVRVLQNALRRGDRVAFYSDSEDVFICSPKGALRPFLLADIAARDKASAEYLADIQAATDKLMGFTK